MKTLGLILLLGLFISNSQAQERLGLSLHQDLKLLVKGDKNHNYNAGTFDFLVRLKMQGNQQKFGFLAISAQFEFANLKVDYYRYSANIGYTLNQFKYVEVTPYASVGIVNHGVGYSNFGLGTEIAVPVGDHFKLSYVGEYINRKELNKNVYSGYIGIEYNF